MPRFRIKLLGGAQDLYPALGWRHLFKLTIEIHSPSPVPHNNNHLSSERTIFVAPHQPPHSAPVVTLTTCGCSLPTIFFFLPCRGIVIEAMRTTTENKQSNTMPNNFEKRVRSFLRNRFKCLPWILCARECPTFYLFSTETPTLPVMRLPTLSCS